MNFKTKLYGTVLTAAMLLSIGSVTAFASNTSDSSFEFDFPSGTNTSYTSARSKYDNTSAYMKLKSMAGSGSNLSYYATVVRSNHSDFSPPRTYVFDSSDINKGRYLANYAYENDGYGVQVRIEGKRRVSTAVDYYASGVWSPDSI